jgi:hypothetical protein
MTSLWDDNCKTVTELTRREQIVSEIPLMRVLGQKLWHYTAARQRLPQNKGGAFGVLGADETGRLGAK